MAGISNISPASPPIYEYQIWELLLSLSHLFDERGCNQAHSKEVIFGFYKIPPRQLDYSIFVSCQRIILMHKIFSAIT